MANPSQIVSQINLLVTTPQGVPESQFKSTAQAFAQLCKEVASKTNDDTGDGTTTATVLAHRLQFANPGVDRSPAHAQGPCDIGDTAETDLQRFDTGIATPMVLRQ